MNRKTDGEFGKASHTRVRIRLAGPQRHKRTLIVMRDLRQLISVG